MINKQMSLVILYAVTAYLAFNQYPHVWSWRSEDANDWQDIYQLRHQPASGRHQSIEWWTWCKGAVRQPAPGAGLKLTVNILPWQLTTPSRYWSPLEALICSVMLNGVTRGRSQTNCRLLGCSQTNCRLHPTGSSRKPHRGRWWLPSRRETSGSEAWVSKMSIWMWSGGA